MKKSMMFLGGVFLIMSLSGFGFCGFDGKYENGGIFGLFDNNCSGQGGYYEEGRCADYAVYR